MDDAQAELAARVRERLDFRPGFREVSMFGGRSFVTNDRMVVSALKQGDLLVRVPASDHDALLARPGASQATMGRGRTMGAGWILVAAGAIDGDDALDAWMQVALEHNRSMAAGA